MDVVIAFVISIFGAMYCDTDFFCLYTIVSIATALTKNWFTYINDKTAKR